MASKMYKLFNNMKEEKEYYKSSIILAIKRVLS